MVPENGSKKVLLTYFLEKSSIHQPSTFRAEYSALKTMLEVQDNTDIKTRTKSVGSDQANHKFCPGTTTKLSQ